MNIRTADWFRDFETFDEIPEPPPPQPKRKRKRKRRPTMEEEMFMTPKKLDVPQIGARRRVETYRGMPQFPQIQDTLKRIAALRLLEIAADLLVTAKKPQPVSADIVLRRLKGWLAAWTTDNANYKRFLKNSTDFKLPYDEWKEDVVRWIEKDVVLHNNVISINLKERSFRNLTGPLEGMAKFLDKALGPFVKKFGWYLHSGAPSEEHESDQHGQKLEMRMYRILPYYGERVTPPQFLYHVTPFDNVERIRSKGLLPSKGRVIRGYDRRMYPDRVYLATNWEFVQNIVLAFNSSNLGEAMYSGRTIWEDYAIFVVDTTKLERGTKFYKDPEAPKDSVWTYSRIPTDAIKLTKKSQKQWDEWQQERAARSCE